MTNENILDAIGGINENAVQDARAYKRPKSKRWFRWGCYGGVSLFGGRYSNSYFTS